MIQQKIIPLFVLGLALFSMFFGSGNLIFPLYVGSITKEYWPWTSLGLMITAVFLPFLGVVAMVFYRGDYLKFFYRIGKIPGSILVFMLLAVWIPFGCAPRCIDLAHAGLNMFVPGISLTFFSLIYSLLLWPILVDKGRIISFLGKFLTPVLLIILAIIILKGLFSVEINHGEGLLEDGNANASAVLFSQYKTPWQAFWLGLSEGYNTMDMIAAFFFSSSLILIMKEGEKSMKSILIEILYAGLIGVSLLAIVYLGMIVVSAQHSAVLIDVPKENLFPLLSKHFLGNRLGIFAGVAVALACFSTSVALVDVFANYLHQVIFKEKYSRKVSIALTLAISFAMSLIGLEGITFITSPLLMIFYPILLVMILLFVGHDLIFKKY